MSQVPLRDYLEKMRTQLHEGQYADVMALGQHVLKYYPKHIETYRLLGEASLETNDLTAAADLFQRVRSADPENTTALVGLSIVHEQHKELEEAIWHLERAFEIQPANEELRKELLRLYAEYEGAPRNRLKLTPGGLARLYTRQGLYSQAIQEFRALLRRDASRADIQAALAETLYRVGRKQEAAEVAQALLEKLPYCLKANLLLGALWSENGVVEAEALLRRAQSLDPEHKVGRELLPDRWDDAPPPMLPALDGEAPTAAPAMTASLPKFDEGAAKELSSVENIPPAPAPAGKAEAPTAPQTGIETGFTAEFSVGVESLTAAPPVQTVAPIQRQVGTYKPTVEPVEEQPVTALPVQLTEEKPVSPLPPAEMPSAAGAAREPKPVRRMQPSLPRIGPTIPGALDKLPAWLRTAAPSATQSAASIPSAGTEESASAGGRLGAFQLPHLEKAQATPAPVTRAPLNAEPSTTELPQWLTRARQAARSGEVEENVAASGVLQEKPAWLTQSDTAPTPGRGAEPPPTGAAASSPSWLRADSAGTTSEQAPEEGALPAWLGASEPEGQAEAPAVGGVLPEWLSRPKQEAETSAAAEASATVPTWLQPSESVSPETPAAITAPTEGLKTLPPGESQAPTALPQAETPAWLGAQAPTVEAAPQVETDETIPEWLREITAATEAEAAAGSAAPAQPSEPPGAKPAQAGIVQAEPSFAITPAPTVSEPVRPEPSIPVAETGMPAQAKEKPEGEPVTSLAQARELWTSGNRPGAIDLYEKALQSGPRFTAEVIADFEQFVKEPDAPIPAHRLLGDAYAMVGRFKEALEQYRIVMGK